MIRCYSELRKIKTFEDRYQYLRLASSIGIDTFGFDRYLNQRLYMSREWQRVRDQVIIRDKGCDLGLFGYEIHGKIIVHHMNPITIKDIELRSNKVFNPEFLICTSHHTHNAIHFGDEKQLPKELVIRTKGDTIPWA